MNIRISSFSGACGLLAVLLISMPINVWADRSADGMWVDVPETGISARGVREIQPNRYRTVALQAHVIDQLDSSASAPSGVDAGAVMYLPLPSGAFGRFLVEESPIMAPALAARYPELMTYRGIGLDDRTATIRMDAAGCRPRRPRSENVGLGGDRGIAHDVYVPSLSPMRIATLSASEFAMKQ